MNDIDHIIIHALNGEASQEELARLEEWINLSSGNDQVFRNLLDFWYQNPNQKSANHIWQKVSKKLNDNSETELKANYNIGKKKTLFSRFRFQLVAGLAFLFATASFWGFPYLFPQKITISTGFGEQKEIILPDQTQVVLNANSKLFYSKDFSREVWLEGEAFFSVTPRYETQETFWVHTEDLSVKVLGTSFNVNRYQEKTEVFLEEGKIELDLQGESELEDEVLMAPGELLVYSAKDAGKFNKKPAAAKAYTSWKDGAAILENAPLGEILTRMEEIYGVKFEVKKEELLNHKYTIAVPMEDLEISIEALKGMLTSRTITRRDDVFIID